MYQLLNSMKTSIPNLQGIGNLIHSGVNSNFVSTYADDPVNNDLDIAGGDGDNKMVFQEVYEEGVEYEESF